jgi:type VI secretion system ImpB/VipA family protein
MAEKRDADRASGIASFGVGFGDDPPPEDRESKGAFRIVVLAQVVPGPDASAGRTPSAAPVAIDAESFDRVLSHFAPSFAVEVDDPFAGGSRQEKPVPVAFVWRDRKSLRPNALVEQVSALRALVEARHVLQDVAARKRSVDDARAQLGRILPRPSWTDALLRGVGASAPKPAPQPASALDALLDLVDVPGGAPASTAPRTPEEASATQRLDLAFRTFVESILRHPEVRRLEATWRALRLLVEQCDKRKGVEVDVVCVDREGAADAIRALASPGDRAPVDLVVVDQTLAPTAADLAHLEAWASLGEGLLAPVLVGGTPTMLGLATLQQVAQSTSALSTSSDTRAVATRAAASRDAARWIAVVMNDVLVRPAHTTSTSRQEEPAFFEDADDEASSVFAAGAYVVAALCARSHARIGWPTAILGTRDGALGDLPVRTARDRGVEAAIPLQVAPSDATVREAARAGLTLLACAPNTDAAVLARAPMLFRPEGGGKPAAASLPDQLFIARFARAVQAVAAAVPADTDPRKAEQVARIALADIFVDAAPPGPDLVPRVDAEKRSLTVTVRPRRFAGVDLDEITIAAALG